MQLGLNALPEDIAWLLSIRQLLKVALVLTSTIPPPLKEIESLMIEREAFKSQIPANIAQPYLYLDEQNYFYEY